MATFEGEFCRVELGIMDEQPDVVMLGLARKKARTINIHPMTPKEAASLGNALLHAAKQVEDGDA